MKTALSPSSAKHVAVAAKAARRTAKAVPQKKRRWTGFAPELCGVMSGPSDLSTREGFARG